MGNDNELFPELKDEQKHLLSVYTRRTCRNFRPGKVEDDKVSLVLEAGRFSPSSGNLQNWDFVVVKTKQQKQNIAEACYEQYWISDADVLIVIISDDKHSQRFYADRGNFYSVQNCAMAAENMLIAANMLGLGSAFVSGFDDEKMSIIMGLHNDFKVQGIVVLGYPEHYPSFPGRKPLYDFVWLEKYGNRIDNLSFVMYDFRIVNYLNEKISPAIPIISKAVKDTAQKARFELLHHELLLKNRQIKSLKDDLQKLHGIVSDLKNKKIVYVKDNNIEGPWGYYVLKQAKGLEYPARRRALASQFKGFKIKNVPIEEIMQHVDVPVDNHKDLLKKVKDTVKHLKRKR